MDNATINMAIQSEILEGFANAIWAKVELLQSGILQERERRRVMESISDDIKKCTDLTPPRVSLAAREEARRREVDLDGMGWHDQPRFDPGRAIFHREHVIPVKTIRARCLDAESARPIVDALKSAEVAWILKSEDRRLTQLGLRSNRPDPADAYRKAGIILEELRSAPNKPLQPPRSTEPYGQRVPSEDGPSG